MLCALHPLQNLRTNSLVGTADYITNLRGVTFLELMSPAGSFEAVQAAVRGGADAVYFGASEFNARRNARNLSDEELGEALKYCRLRGVKTYITVNTLVTDRELLAARPLILRLNALGADAIIVQDLGMARMIRTLTPEMPIHASTQLSVHNLGGILAAQKMGFSRVVLARELPREEIAFLCKHSPLELEIFVHGALCMCYSGQCYLSAAIGGRSGNRGLCAQPCRMRYNFDGEDPSYPLSLKDLSLAQYLTELSDMGVSAVKIEGRMKRPEYTALVTSIYKRAICERRSPTAEELSQLETAFSRDGFTDGYYLGQKPGHKGDGMFGIRSEESGQEVRALYKEAQKIYQSEPEPPTIPVDMQFTARNSEEMHLLCVDGDGNEYESFSSPAVPANMRATTQEEVHAFLCKTGGTVFIPRDIRIELDPGLRLPASTINAMRRKCLDGLTVIRRTPVRRNEGIWQPGVKRLNYPDKPGVIFSFLRFDQITSNVLQYRPDFIYLPLSEVISCLDLAKAINAAGIKIAAVLDRIITDREWPDIIEQLRILHDAGISHLVCTNIGQVGLLEQLAFSLHGDFGLNIMNSQSIKELRQMGLSSCTLSFEMNLAQIRDLSMGMDCQIIAYGRLPLMITENCVFRRKNETCSCDSGAALIDKTGRSFPLHRENYCRTTIYNAEPLYLADKLSDISDLGLRWLRFCFTTETTAECEAVIRAYTGGTSAKPERMTRGLYYRGVQ